METPETMLMAAAIARTHVKEAGVVSADWLREMKKATIMAVRPPAWLTEFILPMEVPRVEKVV